MDFLSNTCLLIDGSIRPNASIKGKRVSIVHSLDLIGKQSISRLRKDIDDDVILALDAISYDIILEISDNPCTTILFPDQIFTPDERLFMASSAQSLELEWHKSIPLDKSIRDLLSLDRLALAGYWLETVFELSLIRKLKISEATPGIVVRYDFADLPIRQQKSGSFGHVLQHRYGEKYVRLFSSSNLLSFFKRPLCLITSLLKLAWLPFQQDHYKPISGKILFVANNAEQAYYAKALNSLFDSAEVSSIVKLHPDKNAIACLAASIWDKNRRFEFGLPVIPALVLDQFLQLSLDSSTKRSLKFLRTFLSQEYFESKDPSVLILSRYVSERLPRLLASTHILSSIFFKYKPRSIIHTNALDYEIFQFNIISKMLSLNTYVVSHGTLAPPQRSASFYGEYICGSKVSKSLLQHMQVLSNEITVRPAFNIEREYPTFTRVEFSAASKTSVLVLLDPIICNDRSRCYSALGIVGYAEQISGLRILSSYIDDPRLELAFKHHPGWAEHELYKIGSPCLLDHFLPPLSDLTYCAGQADLVIALNYLQAALIPVTRLAKPIIHLTTSPLLLDKASSKPFRNSFLMLDSGDVAVSNEELSILVERFVSSVAYRRSLSAKSLAFHQTWISDN